MKFCSLFLLLFVATASAAGPVGQSSFETTAQTRVGFDSNPLGTSGTTALLFGHEDTLTYAAGASLALTLPDTAHAAVTKLSYAVEALRFDQYAEENHATHRFAASHQATLGAGKFSFDASSLFIAGDAMNPTATSTINANAIPLWRERRRQWQHRAKLQAETHAGRWLLRGGLTWLDYDYQTQTIPGKFTLADRSDLQAAGEVGWQQNARSLWFVGVRPGWQRQALVPLPNCDFEYSNAYWKLATGWEGRVGQNTTVTLAAGPDFRHYTGAINPLVFTGGRHRTSLWFEGGFTTQVSPRLRVSGKAARLNWLSSTGQSAYTDSSAEAAAVFTLSSIWETRLSAKLHQCDYFPSVRDDWETLLGAGVTLKLSPRISLGADLLRHEAWNALPNPSERAFHRFTASVGATCRF